MDLRVWLNHFLEEQPPAAKLSQREIAQKMGILPSHLTNALKGRAQFSADALYAFSEALKLSALQRDLLLELNEYEKAQNRGLKAEKKKKLEKLLSRAKKLSADIANDDPKAGLKKLLALYLDPIAFMVFVFLRIDDYRKNPEKIAAQLELKPAALKRVLLALESHGWIARDQHGHWRRQQYQTHLAEYPQIVDAHQDLMRLESSKRLRKLTKDLTHSLMLTATTNAKTMEEVREIFKEAVKKAKRLIDASDADRVFQINLEIFPWDLDV